MIAEPGFEVLAKIYRSLMPSFLSRYRIPLLVSHLSPKARGFQPEGPLTAKDALASIAQAIIILTGSYWLGVSYPLLILVFYLVQRFYLRTSRQLRLLDLEAKSPL